MRIDRGMLGWGVFFLVAGAIPLAVNAGVVSGAAIDRWWSYWPLILVGIGLGLILARTALSIVGGLVVAATFGLMVGGAAATGITGFGDLSVDVCDPTGGGRPFETRTGTLGPRAEVDVELDCGQLKVDVGDGNGWSVAGSDGDGTGPDIESTPERLEVSPDGDVSTILGGRDSFEVRLPAASTLDVSLEMNAGSFDVDLGPGTIGSLDVEVNAASGTIDLIETVAIGSMELGANATSVVVWLPRVSTSGSIQANAGSVTLCTDGTIGLRIETGNSVIASYDFASAGLVQNGSVWQTPGYEAAAVKVDLRTEANAGSVSLNTEACRT